MWKNQAFISDTWLVSEGSTSVGPWKNLFGWSSNAISAFLFNGPRILGVIVLVGLWLLLIVNSSIGLATGARGEPVQLIQVCDDVEEHSCSIPIGGEAAGDKSKHFGEAGFSRLLSLELAVVHAAELSSSRFEFSFQGWPICIAVCTSHVRIASLFIKSMPSSRQCWVMEVILFPLALSVSAWNICELSPSPLITGALLDLLKMLPSVVLELGWSSKSSSIFSSGMSVSREKPLFRSEFSTFSGSHSHKDTSAWSGDDVGREKKGGGGEEKRGGSS